MALDSGAKEVQLGEFRIEREPAARSRLGDCHTVFYENITEGLITRGVKISARAVGWPAHEIDALVKARIAGASKAEIKSLVERLHADRARMAEGLFDTGAKAAA